MFLGSSDFCRAAFFLALFQTSQKIFIYSPFVQVLRKKKESYPEDIRFRKDEKCLFWAKICQKNIFHQFLLMI